jgi:folylpolyglutamate synthase/dihydropteroate synthase
MADKDYRLMVEILGSAVDEAVAVAPAMDRALSAETLRGEFARIDVPCGNGGDPFAGLGLAQGKAAPEDLIFCTGSHYTVGEILEAIGSQKA